MVATQSLQPEAEQIARILGLPRPRSFDDAKLVGCIRDGIPAQSAAAVALAIDPVGAHLKAYHLVSKSTLHRRETDDKPLSTDDSETLWQVARVYVEALRQYRDAEAASAFLFRQHPLLGGQRPIDLARETTAGADLVLKLLAQAEAGIAI